MLERERKHISYHIEKTAGVSVKRFLVELYGAKNVFFYNREADGFYRADDIHRIFKSAPIDSVTDKLIRYASSLIQVIPFERIYTVRMLFRDENTTEASRLPENWMAVHGHFDIDRFDGLVADPFRTVVLRDPLARTISHYGFWKRSRGLLNDRSCVPFDPNLSFVDFAFLDNMQNFQTKFLGKMNLEDFDVVGVTEDLQNFIRRVAQKRGVNPHRFEVMHLNQGVGRVDLLNLGIDAFFIRKFKSLYAGDYDNYYKARRLSDL